MQYTKIYLVAVTKINGVTLYATSLWFVMFQDYWKLFLPNPGP